MKSLTLFFIFTFIVSFGQQSDFKNISFKKADSIAHSYKGESLDNLPLLTQKLSVNLKTNVEKFRAIYTWVCTNIENDYSSYLKTRKKRKKLYKNREALLQWNSSFTPKVFKNLQEQKKTACTGYAYLIRELTVLAGIECKIINGFGRTAALNLQKGSLPNHSWNAIKLNGKWYLSDATWSAGKVMIEDNYPKFIPEYFDGYFLANPALFIKNHYPLDLEWTLLDNTPTFSQFINGPILYKEAFTYSVIPVFPKKMHLVTQKNTPIKFTLSKSSAFTSEEIALVLVKGDFTKTVTPNITINENICQLQYIFNRTGSYDVHIKIEESIIATYTVKITK
ncbi:transglutaminase domain-containing protein [uncultured Maribacter sp.]|uniref:transglutaminase domain-containing protein n=1 Tax=uncultured Maribacter sp. TaxID=431308 RepID=UPI0026182504|nr:transglutaminase domain-containing protein [uncultured Maribacter sp.]